MLKIKKHYVVIYSKEFMSNGKAYRGRLPNGKISLNQKENQICVKLISKGLSHEIIAKQLKMTISQVQRRAKLANISVMDYRRGKGEESKRILSKYSVVYKN
jgi:hypothetical protein